MFIEKKCACCGKTMIRRSFNDYTYKRGWNFYCGWNCFRKDDVVVPPLDNTCVCCGKRIPEGSHVCKTCEKLAKKKQGGDMYYREHK